MRGRQKASTSVRPRRPHSAESRIRTRDDHAPDLTVSMSAFSSGAAATILCEANGFGLRPSHMTLLMPASDALRTSSASAESDPEAEGTIGAAIR